MIVPPEELTLSTDAVMAAPPVVRLKLPTVTPLTASSNVTR